MSSAVARDELHPERRALDERHGRHVEPRTSAEEEREHRADQTHVVVLMAAENTADPRGFGVGR